MTLLNFNNSDTFVSKYKNCFNVPVPIATYYISVPPVTIATYTPAVDTFVTKKLFQFDTFVSKYKHYLSLVGGKRTASVLS
jgi:spore maturation protein CgeB